MKIVNNVTIIYSNVKGLFFTVSGEKTEMTINLEKWFGDTEKIAERFSRMGGKMIAFASWCWENYDSVFLFLAGIYMLWKIFDLGERVATHTGGFREEERIRDNALARLLERQHQENLAEQKKLREGIERKREGEGLGGALGNMGARLDAHEGLMRDDRTGSGGGGGTGGNQAGAPQGMSSIVQRLLRRAVNPLSKVTDLIKNLRTVRPWNFPAGYEVRLAADWAAAAYQHGGMARTHAQQVREIHGLKDATFFNVYDAICDIADAAILDDNDPDLMNRHWFERLARYGYGLLEVVKDCQCEKDWNGDKKTRKTRWELLPYYHPTAKKVTTAHSRAAQDEVTEQLKNEATFRKYLEKGLVDGS